MVALTKKSFSILIIIALITASGSVYAYSTIYSINNANVQVDNSTVTINNSTVTIGDGNTIITPSPSPTTTTEQPTTETPEPTSTPSPTPQIQTPANLIVNCAVKLHWSDSPKPMLWVSGSIKNIGTQTAYGVTIHVKTWFSNGTEAITIDHLLNVYDGHSFVPFIPVDIKGNETYNGGTLAGMRGFSIPNDICKNWAMGYVDNDCISTFQITATWNNAP